MSGARARGAAEEVSLRGRLRTALLAGGVVLVLVVAWAGFAFSQMAERQRDITVVYYAALTQGTASYLSLVDAETAVRGYALTGDEVTLEPYTRLLAGESEIPEDVRDVDTEALLLDRFGEDYPPLQARVAAGDAALRWYEGFAVPTVAQVGAEGPDSVTAADVAAGQALFDEVRASAEEYLDELRADRGAAVEAFQTWRDVLLATLVALVAAAVVVGWSLWVLLRRWITDPMDVLAADARRVAEGDLEHVVTTAGPAEVGAMAADVEAMRARLALLVADATRARAEVERSHALLEEQAEDLRRSNRDLEQFAYVASHDLQEPLRKVASFTQLLAKRYEGQLDERADQYIAFAVDGAKRMQRLINDLLSFSRVGRIGGEVADVDLARALEQVTGDLDHVVAQTGARVEGHDLPVVRGEGPLLVQLLQNLVGNALKFRHPDRTPVVRVSARRDGDCWEFACADNGIGIDAQYADRVFVIFQRLHPKDVYEGTGIGLALCKKIVEYHGGHIWIDTDASEGTTIRWRLPADLAVAPQTPEGAGAGRDAAHADETPPPRATNGASATSEATPTPADAGNRKD